MSLPFFFMEQLDERSGLVSLNEETSKHVVQVLRMENNEALLLTNGRGDLFACTITDNHRKKCMVQVATVRQAPKPKTNSIAISLVKNNTRFEWFLEKATELGISGIIPLICTRTEKQHFRHDRMKNILVSAMLQSQQAWLPVLSEPVRFEELVSDDGYEQKFIAHCEAEAERKSLSSLFKTDGGSAILLIGPEGDFTTTEIALAVQHDFKPVSLGDTRLRTETAGLAGAVILSAAGH